MARSRAALSLSVPEFDEAWRDEQFPDPRARRGKLRAYAGGGSGREAPPRIVDWADEVGMERISREAHRATAARPATRDPRTPVEYGYDADLDDWRPERESRRADVGDYDRRPERDRLRAGRDARSAEADRRRVDSRGYDERPEPSPNRVPGADGVAGRRTVTIRGQVAPRPAQRRPARRADERLGSRPDRIAMWAVLLCVVMILVAATSSHAAVVDFHHLRVAFHHGHAAVSHLARGRARHL